MKPVFGPGVVYDCDPKKRNLQMQRTSSALKSSRLRSYVDKIKAVSVLFFFWGGGGRGLGKRNHHCFLALHALPHVMSVLIG